MDNQQDIKNTPMLLLFGMLFTIIFGLWFIKKISSNKDHNKSLSFLILENLNLIAGILIGVVLLFIAFFL